MNPFADEFESRLARTIFKWITVFFAVLMTASLLIEVRFGILEPEDFNFRLFVRAALLFCNIGVSLWAFLSKTSDKNYLLIPPVFLLWNFGASVFMTATGHTDVLIAAGTYIRAPLKTSVFRGLP